LSNVIHLDQSLRKREQIIDRASAYITRLDAGASEADKAEIRNWLAESEQHRTVFLQMAALWDELSILESLKELFPVDSQHSRQAGRPTVFGKRCIAAGIAILMIGSLGWKLLSPPADIQAIASPESITLQVHSTSRNEQKTINLADGSTILLNINSRLIVKDTDEGIHAFLEQGEAYLDVAPGNTESVRVFAGRQMIDARGQMSLLRHDSDSLEILVEEGTATRTLLPDSVDALMSPGNLDNILASSWSPFVIGPGQMVNLLPSLPIDNAASQLDAEQMENLLSWTDGTISFDQQTLDEVFETISRYTGLLVDAVDTVRDIPVQVTYSIGDTESLLDALRRDYNIQSMEVGENHLLLYGGPRAPIQ
jgi:transmembrane sensor